MRNCSNKQRVRLPCWITNLLTRLGDRIFATSDAAALAHGWHIRRTRRGLGRSYRDPRFELLGQCSDCAGSGYLAVAARGCCSCGGTGRVRLGRAGQEPRALS
jgi:hypothetical protein